MQHFISQHSFSTTAKVLCISCQHAKSALNPISYGLNTGSNCNCRAF